MKVAFFTDIHGNQYALRSIISKLNKINPDIIVFGGDVFGYYYGQREILEKLQDSGIHCLLGNHDQMFLNLIDGLIQEDYLIGRYGNSYRGIKEKIPRSSVDFLRTLKPELTMTVDNLNLYFAHGSKEDPLNGRIYPDTEIADKTSYNKYDYAFLGHTHHEIFKQADSCTIINPGSSGQQRDGKGCKYLCFDTATRSIEINKVEYDRSKLVEEIEKNDSGNMKDRLIEVLFREA